MANSHDKTEYVIHIRNLKQALNHGLVLKKVVHKVIKFNQNAWLKPYIDMNTDLRKNTKNDFQKVFLSWWIMQFLEKLWKMWENIEILNLSQQKDKELFSIGTKLSYYKVCHWKFFSNRDIKNWNTYK